jgi:hypothetical protein
MGILSALRLANYSRPESVVSPWTDAQLKSFVWSDVFGNADNVPVTRAEAMRVPGVAKARNLLAPTIGRQPLKALDANGELTTQPTWTYRTDQDLVSMTHLMTWVADDLLFLGRALLSVKRGSDGFPVSIDRVSPDRYTITDGSILIDEQPVDARSVIFIPGLVDGLLDIGARTIRGARYVEEAWVGRVRNPVPTTVLQQTESDSFLEQDEVEDIIRKYSAARRDPDGAVTFVPYGLSLSAMGENDSNLFVEARNALRIDIGSYVGVPSTLMDATTVQASLTYENKEGARDRFYVEALPLYASAIEARLSLDDVVPRGQRVRFDFSELYAQLPAATGPITED